MSQCLGRTKKGGRCKREASDASEYCAIHQDQALRPRSPGATPWTTEDIVKAAIGAGLIAAIFLFRFRR